MSGAHQPAADRAGDPSDLSLASESQPKALIPCALARVERFLGSPTVSWLCIVVLLIRADFSWFEFLLIGIPLANYTVRIEQIHAKGMSAGTAETAQQAQGEARQPGAEGIRP